MGEKFVELTAVVSFNSNSPLRRVAELIMVPQENPILSLCSR